MSVLKHVAVTVKETFEAVYSILSLDYGGEYRLVHVLLLPRACAPHHHPSRASRLTLRGTREGEATSQAAPGSWLQAAPAVLADVHGECGVVNLKEVRLCRG